MNNLVIVFLLINAILLLLLPRRWAPFPLLVGASYMTLGSGIVIGPFHFMVLRILLAIAIVRVIIRGERLVGKINKLDWLILLWAAWALTSSFFHIDISNAIINRLGLVYNACGIYFLLRIFCRTLDDVIRLCRITAILLVPLSIAMLFEQMTGHNLFSILGGVSDISEVRDGRIRAQGPFAHSILAGTVGAVSLPLMFGLWRYHRTTAIAGIVACGSMVFASRSSGPIMSSIFALTALIMWHWRNHMRLIRWLAVLTYIGLDLIMNAPAYYLIARIDLTGSSASWHRAALIDAALAHISEWWFAGTDFTRHWMAYGALWSGNQIDFTNYYLRMGVDGGLALMGLFIGVLAISFSFVGQMLRQTREFSPESEFMIWALGASLFTHSVTFIAVSYFDQSYVFIYLTIATIGSVWSGFVQEINKTVLLEERVHGII